MFNIISIMKSQKLFLIKNFETYFLSKLKRTGEALVGAQHGDVAVAQQRDGLYDVALVGEVPDDLVLPHDGELVAGGVAELVGQVVPLDGAPLARQALLTCVPVYYVETRRKILQLIN